MANAGEYFTRFIWLQYDSSVEPRYGQPEPSYAENGELWGALQDLKSSEQIALGRIESRADCKIRILNQPALGFKDRLQDKGTGDVYEIDGINKAVNELIIYAHRGA